MVTLFFPRSPHFLLRSTCSSHGHLFFLPSSVFFSWAREIFQSCILFLLSFTHPFSLFTLPPGLFPGLLPYSQGCYHFPTVACIFPGLLVFSQDDKSIPGVISSVSLLCVCRYSLLIFQSNNVPGD